MLDIITAYLATDCAERRLCAQKADGIAWPDPEWTSIMHRRHELRKVRCNGSRRLDMDSWDIIRRAANEAAWAAAVRKSDVDNIDIAEVNRIWERAYDEERAWQRRRMLYLLGASAYTTDITQVYDNPEKLPIEEVKIWR